MFKKLLLATTILMGSIACTQNAHAQDQDKKDDKVLERPNTSGTNVDAYMVKAFDTYDESRKITKDIYFIKVDIKEVKPNKDGITTQMTITNGNGEALTKTGALEQFGQLLVRSMKQNENIKTLIDLQKPAAEGAKSAPMMKKPKAAKELSAAGDAQAYVVAETKKQIDLLNQQISTLKALKNN